MSAAANLVDGIAVSGVLPRAMSKIALPLLISVLLLSGCGGGSPYRVETRDPGTVRQEQDIDTLLRQVKRERQINDTRSGM